jgi:alpha-L-fucosidase 2
MPEFSKAVPMITRRHFFQGGATAALVSGLSRRLPAQTPAPTKDELWYAEPAQRWLEALPLGNGHLGAMVFGGTGLSRIALSESTAWSGKLEQSDVNPQALAHLAEIRKTFFEGKPHEANELCKKYLLGHSSNFGTNAPLPELRITHEGIGDVSHYRRSLNLHEAVATVAYRSGSKRIEQNFFATHADRVLVLHLASSQPQSFHIAFNPNELPCSVTFDGQQTLRLTGRVVETKHSDGVAGVSFAVHCRVLGDDATISAGNNGMAVRSGKPVTLFLAIATSFEHEDPAATCAAQLDAAARFSYQQLLTRHLSDYQPLYQRMSLRLGQPSIVNSETPTNLRRQALMHGAADRDLEALFFQYGRYLTIAGSRADSPLPLALQGIWNDGLAASMGWTDDFHLDINTQQNYWTAEVCNLAECQTPLFSFLERLQKHGASTAREMYGAKGWVAHTITNPWGYTAPGGGQGWGLHVTAGVWIALQMWQHYEFTLDETFLRTRCYPLFKDASAFFMDYLVAEPKHGWLVTGPSDSPENWYKAPDGRNAAESMGPTVDRVFVFALLSICISASEKLGADDDLRQRWSEALSKLPPLQIGKYGQVQEWLEDFEEAIPNHRHTSHLTALYPENQINVRSTPELAKAAEVTIRRRADAPDWEQTEWGRANFIAFYARLLQGEKAHRYVLDLIAHAADDNLLSYSAAGVAGAEQNIFALDGNTGGTAAMAEMLLQSQGGEIEFLPALPSAWSEGAVRGLCARGGYEVDIAWSEGALVSAKVRARFEGPLRLRYRDSVRTFTLHANRSLQLKSSDFVSSRSIA